MSPEPGPTGAVLLVSILCGAVAAAVFWYIGSRFLDGSGRTRVSRIGALLVFVITSAGLFAPLRATSNQVAARCIVCGREAYVYRILGLHFADVHDEPAAGRWVHATQGARATHPGALVRDYGSVFQDLIAPHDHRWHGFQASGLWFTDLPRLPDQDLARAYVRRLGTITDVLRTELMDAYEAHAQRSLVDHAFGTPDFKEWRAFWRVAHPDWP